VRSRVILKLPPKLAFWFGRQPKERSPHVEFLDELGMKQMSNASQVGSNLKPIDNA